MITTINQPPAMDFTKNPLLVELETNEYYTTAPVGESFTITIGNSVMENGDFFTVGVLDFENNQVQSVTVTAVATPDKDGTEVPDDSGVYSLVSRAQDYIKYLYYGTVFPMYFDITYTITDDGSPEGLLKLLFTYKTTRNATLGAWNSNPSLALGYTVKVAGVTRDFFKIILEVLDADGASIARLAQTPNTNSRATFNISNLLHQALEVLGLPGTDLIAIEAPQPYDLVAAEQWEGDLKNWSVIASNLIAIRNTERFDYFTGTSNSIATLSYISSTKRLSSKAKEWLYWINQVTTDKSIKAQMKVTWNDNTNSGWSDIANSTQTVEPSNLYVLNVSPETTGLFDVDTNKTVALFEIRLYDTTASVAVSDELKYKIIPNKPHFKNVIFLNQLGVWESLETKGYWSQGVEVTREFANTIEDTNRTRSLQFSTERQYSHIVRTGYLTTKESEAIDRLILSDYIYYMDGEGNWVQLLLNIKGISKSSRDRLFAFELNVVEALR